MCQSLENHHEHMKAFSQVTQEIPIHVLLQGAELHNVFLGVVVGSCSHNMFG